MGSSRRPDARVPSAVRTLLAIGLLVTADCAASRVARGAWPWSRRGRVHEAAAPCTTCVPSVGDGAWYWVRSPEQERQALMSLYARYCVRCHGIDGRGVWDIPGVPDFTDIRWQASRDDGAIARAILEGRGACMPPFRGTMTLEEAHGMAHYLRTFVPGTEVSPPETGRGAAPARRGASLPPPIPAPAARGAFAH